MKVLAECGNWTVYTSGICAKNPDYFIPKGLLFDREEEWIEHLKDKRWVVISEVMEAIKILKGSEKCKR